MVFSGVQRGDGLVVILIGCSTRNRGELVGGSGLTWRGSATEGRRGERAPLVRKLVRAGTGMSSLKQTTLVAELSKEEQKKLRQLRY